MNRWLALVLIVAAFVAGGYLVKWVATSDGWIKPTDEVVPVVEENVVPVGEQEAAGMVVELFLENQILREQVMVLEQDLELAQRQLAEALARIDTARISGSVAVVPQAAPVAEVSVESLSRVRILDVNREMQVAVISGGARSGMKAGMVFHVLREDRAIGRLRLVDVRDTIAGGLVEQMEKGGFPEVGDRVVLSSKQDS